MMLCEKLCIISLLCFEAILLGGTTLTEREKDNIRTAINNSLKLKTTGNDKTKNNGKEDISSNPIDRVEFKDTKYWESQNIFMLHIYTYKFTPSESQLITYQVNCLYICVSCNFAIMIKNLLFYFIRDSPLIKPTHSVYSQKNIRSEFRYAAFIRTYDLYFDKFISILSTLIEVESSLIFSHETIILETLYSLKFKLYLNSTIFLEPNESTTLETLIIINALQSFILTNCHEDALQKEDIIKTTDGLFGYTINLSILKDVIPFMHHIEHFNIRTQPVCKIGTVLLIKLENEKESVKNLYSDIERTMISVERKKRSINNLFERARSTGDIVIIYNCMKHITRAFMYLIHTKIDSYLTQFEKLNNKNRSTLKCFLKNLNTEMFPKDIIIYLNFVDRKLSSFKTPTELTNQILIHFKEPFTGVEIQDQNSIYELSDFIDDIMMFKEDFECFSKVYSFLHIAFGRNIKLYEGIENKIKNHQSSIELNTLVENSYNFIKLVYLACINITSSINKAANILDKDDSNKSVLLKNVCLQYDYLKIYFLFAINDKTKTVKDKDFFNIVSNVAYILTNFKCLEMGEFPDNFKRPVYLIMTELSMYGYEHYSILPNRKSYMLFNNVELGKIDNEEFVYNEIIQFFKNSGVKLPSDDRFNLKLIYTNIVQTSEIIVKFKKKIKFYWKGGLKSLDEMFIHAMSPITLNYRYLYEIHENVLKFFSVAFYLQVKKFYKDTKSINEERIKNFNECVNNFEVSSFPYKIRTLVNSLKNNAIIPLTVSYGKFSSKNWCPEKFLTAITDEWLVVVEDESRKMNISIPCFHNEENDFKENITYLEKINSELKKAVNYTLHLF